jgi:hypothetical protein
MNYVNFNKRGFNKFYFYFIIKLIKELSIGAVQWSSKSLGAVQIGQFLKIFIIKLYI